MQEALKHIGHTLRNLLLIKTHRPLTNPIQQAWLPELVYVDGEFRSDVALRSDNEGRIVSVGSASDALRADPHLTTISLKNKAILPGLINSHSHAFQRVIRGRTEYRSQHSSDSFWTWRELMYRAANLLDPNDVYIASKMAFLEMALSGVLPSVSFITFTALQMVNLTTIQIYLRRK